MNAGPEEIARAVTRLREGRLVAFPTETVYGLGALALDPDAVARVFTLKGRPATNPLIVHVSGEGMAEGLTTRWSDDASRLAQAFWPGPLTLVLPRAGRVPPIVAGGGETVAIRCPDHLLALAIIETLGEPLVGPSANRSGFVSPTTAAHVESEFGEAIESEELMVVDGGPCRAGIESTVVSLVGAVPLVLRPGVIGSSEIAAALGREVATDGGTGDASEPLQSPGRLASHYAPRARAVLVEPEAVSGIVSAATRPVAVLTVDEVALAEPHWAIRLPRDARGYAASLYTALREADARSPGLLVIVRPPVGSRDAAVWEAVMDRLRRATAPRG